MAPQTVTLRHRGLDIRSFESESQARQSVQQRIANKGPGFAVELQVRIHSEAGKVIRELKGDALIAWAGEAARRPPPRRVKAVVGPTRRRGSTSEALRPGKARRKQERLKELAVKARPRSTAPSIRTPEALKSANAYEPWDGAMEAQLVRLFGAGKTVAELARLFGRSPSAIRGRLQVAPKPKQKRRKRS